MQETALAVGDEGTTRDPASDIFNIFIEVGPAVGKMCGYVGCMGSWERVGVAMYATNN